MFFRTSEPTPGIGFGSSNRARILGIRGESVPLELSAPSKIPVRREEPSERTEAGQLPACDLSSSIQGALLNGRRLCEIEAYLDWLENACPSVRT